MKNTSARRASKSKSYDHQDEQEGTQKKSNGLLQSDTQNNGVETELKQCSDISTSSVESADLVSQPRNSEEYEQLSLLKLTPTLNSSCDRISQEFQFTPISETISQGKENSILSGVHSPAQVQATQELEQDYLTQSQHFGEKDLDVLSRLNPSSVLSNNLKELSDEDFELFLADSVWQDTITKLKQSRRESLERVIKDSDYLSFPTLTSNENSTSRPAGQTKCEKWFKDNGLIPNGSQLSAQAIASLMNFPTDWFSPLSPTKLQEELEPGILQDEQLPQDKQRSHSLESSISIPCLIKQPHKKPFEGLIVGDRGTEFDIKVDDRLVSLPKLYVFPNFQKQKEKCRTDDDISPSKIRRKKGTGSGSIYWRTITKNGKEYKQTYYHYELWDKGDRKVKSCVYVPKSMRSQIEKMNHEKAPVEEILKVLKNRAKRK
jgi:hypothetical protein